MGRIFSLFPLVNASINHNGLGITSLWLRPGGSSISGQKPEKGRWEGMPRERITGRSYARVWSSLPCTAESRGAETRTLGCQTSSPLHLFLVFWSKGVFWNLVKEEVSWESGWVTMKGQTRFPKRCPRVFGFVLFLRERFLYPTLTSNSLYSHIWLWTPHLFASISQSLGLQAWAPCQLKTEAVSSSLEPMNS